MCDRPVALRTLRCAALLLAGAAGTTCYTPAARSRSTCPALLAPLVDSAAAVLASTCTQNTAPLSLSREVNQC